MNFNKGRMLKIFGTKNNTQTQFERHRIFEVESFERSIWKRINASHPDT